MTFNNGYPNTNHHDTYYYSRDIAKLFNVDILCLARAIKIGIVPKPEIIKERHVRVRRWLKTEIDALLADYNG